jgi:hypothetical protein
MKNEKIHGDKRVYLVLSKGELKDMVAYCGRGKNSRCCIVDLELFDIDGKIQAQTVKVHSVR